LITHTHPVPVRFTYDKAVVYDTDSYFLQKLSCFKRTARHQCYLTLLFS